MSRDRSRSRSPRSPERRRRRSRSRDASPLNENVVLYKELSRKLRDDPFAFDVWSKVLGLVEALDNVDYARESYEPFLKRFPFCYGYWRKYAEFERRHRNYDKALIVYEQGVKAIPLSPELWISYIDYVKDISENKRDSVQKIRMLYMRAVQGCGSDFRSDAVWKQLVDFEVGHQEYRRAMAVYDLIMTTGTIGYKQQWDSFLEFVNAREPDEMLTAEEYEDITKELLRDRLKNFDGPLYVNEEYEKQVLDDDGQLSTTVVKRRKHVEAALTAYRDVIIARRSKTFANTEREINRRWIYEGAIKRPYFHVKPLELEQLRNWHAYIDFEIAEPETKSSKKRVHTLFQRCLIACAIYDEMWIKYATYLDSDGEEQAARTVFRKAVDVHCGRKPGIHLAFSAFEEKHGNLDLAEKILADFDRKYPGFIAVDLRRIGLTRRRIQKAKSDKGDYSSVVTTYEKLMMDATCPQRMVSFYALKLARFHLKVRHDRKAADKVLREAIRRDSSNVKIYLALVDVHASSSHFKEADVIDAFELAIKAKDLTLEERFEFSQRRVDFLEELSSDASKLNQAWTEHITLEMQLPIPPATAFHGKRFYTGKDEVIDRKRARTTVLPLI